MSIYAKSNISKLSANEKQSLIWNIEEESNLLRAQMEDATKSGHINIANRLENELEANDSFIAAIKDNCL